MRSASSFFFSLQMLPYFDATSSPDWTIADVLKAAENAYPEKDRFCHVYVAKENLKALKSHIKESHRRGVEYLLNNW